MLWVVLLIMIDDDYHIPVLLHAAVDGLVQNLEGIYVDVTYGGGGHSKEILSRINDGILIGFDQDQDALRNLVNDERFKFIGQNFSFLKNNLRMLNHIPVDGVLADLGVSSHQFDTSDRGFSYRFEGKLDMRMNRELELDAIHVLNHYDENELIRVFKSYGELRESKRLTRIIVKARNSESIESIEEFVELIQKIVPRNKTKQFLSRVFQAIRIEVNAEMEVLKKLLEQCVEVLKPGGRLVIITYHSLEDRMVKNFFKTGNIDGKMEKDFYGNVIRPFKEINRKPMVPSTEEISINNRARSAKLRIAEKIKIE